MAVAGVGAPGVGSALFLLDGEAAPFQRVGAGQSSLGRAFVGPRSPEPKAGAGFLAGGMINDGEDSGSAVVI